MPFAPPPLDASGPAPSSNYGPTIAVQNEALKRGCQQVLWLYGEKEEITEVGTMNLFIYWTNEKGGSDPFAAGCFKNALIVVMESSNCVSSSSEKELFTPPLDGIILPGVTRQSLLDLARSWVGPPGRRPTRGGTRVFLNSHFTLNVSSNFAHAKVKTHLCCTWFLQILMAQNYMRMDRFIYLYICVYIYIFNLYLFIYINLYIYSYINLYI